MSRVSPTAILHEAYVFQACPTPKHQLCPTLPKRGGQSTRAAINLVWPPVACAAQSLASTRVVDCAGRPQDIVSFKRAQPSMLDVRTHDHTVLLKWSDE